MARIPSLNLRSLLSAMPGRGSDFPGAIVKGASIASATVGSLRESPSRFLKKAYLRCMGDDPILLRATRTSAGSAGDLSFLKSGSPAGFTVADTDRDGAVHALGFKLTVRAHQSLSMPNFSVAVAGYALNGDAISQSVSIVNPETLDSGDKAVILYVFGFVSYNGAHYFSPFVIRRSAAQPADAVTGPPAIEEAYGIASRGVTITLADTFPSGVVADAEALTVGHPEVDELFPPFAQSE